MLAPRHVIPLVAFLSACAAAPVTEFEVTAEHDEQITTVINVSWTTDEPGVSWVEFGRDGAYDLITPVASEASTEHSFQLIGVSASTEVSFRCVTEFEDGQLVSEGSATTGALPEGIARFQVDSYDEDLASDQKWMLTGYDSEDGSWMVALDRRGGVVWYEAVPEDGMPYTVELLEDGPGVLYNARQADGARDKSWLVSTTLLKDVDSQVTLPMGHHGMTQLPQGGVAWIGADIRPWIDPRNGETVDVQGDTIMVLTPEGENIELFNAWDWAQPSITPWFDSEYFENTKDWTHANTVDYNDELGTILFSLRNLALLLELDVETSEVVRVHGGNHPEAYTEGSGHFTYQHDPNWTDEGTILMVSTAPKENGKDETVAIEYQIDPDSGGLHEIWSYGRGMGLHAPYHGAARALPNGNRLVNFGAAGVIHEATAAGETAWAIDSTPAVALGSSVMVDSLYDLVQ